MNLAGRRILLTGAGGGIGQALAAAFVDAGAHVLLAGRDVSTLQRAAAALSQDSERTLAVACDLTKAADRTRLCAIASSWQGGVDLLVNNAGVPAFALLQEMEPDELEGALSVNLMAPIDLCRQLLPHLGGKPQAHIVNIGSVLGSIGLAANSVYSAAKFGLRGFSEALRRELAGTSIRVHYFAPRATRTALNSTAVDELNALLGNEVDDPRTVAAQIVRELQKDRAEYVIGWPEKFFARVNGLVPRIVDRVLFRQLSTIHRHAQRARSANVDPDTRHRRFG